MTAAELRLLARLAALELLVENLYAAALMQCVDPVATARRWAGELPALAREARIEAGVVDDVLARAMVESLAGELDVLFGRILRRLQDHAEAQPTAGAA